MANEKFCLRWTDFESNIGVAFRELREEKDFFDVTLVCNEDQIQAHKVILSACSPFFRSILKRNPHTHPLIYLRGMKLNNLQSVIEFMYNGEANVAQEELNSFLAVAEELKIKGLTENQPNKKQGNSSSAPLAKSDTPRLSDEHPSTRTLPPTMVLQPKRHSVPLVENDTAQEFVYVKSEPFETSTIHQDQAHLTNLQSTEGDYGAEEDYQDQHDEEGNEMLQSVEVNRGDFLHAHQCEECLKWYTSRRSLREHTASHQGKTNCQFCGKTFSTVSSRNMHVKNQHSDQYDVNGPISG